MITHHACNNGAVLAPASELCWTG